MTLSKIVLFVCIAFIGGIGLASFFQFGQVVLLTVFLVASCMLVVFWRSPAGACLALCILAAALGIWRQETQESHVIYDATAFFLYEGQEVEFLAKVVKAPEERFSGMHAVVQPEFVSEGRILLTTRDTFDVRYSDVVILRGKLERPGVFEDFNYEEFLAKDGIYAIMREPAVEIKQRETYSHGGEKEMAVIFMLKTKFRNVLEEHLSPRHSSVMVEMLLGDKDVMSDDLAENLNAAGLRHVIAISGMHIAILTVYVMSFLIFLGLWRHQAFYVTLILMVFYVILTGAQPSALRAGVMGGMFLLGEQIGRQYAALRALIFSATGMLLLNPLLLARDVGFQLSFLAVLGMIVLLPLVLSFLPKKMPGRQLLAMTIAAQIFTFPVLMWSFGQISVVSIISNMLIVPVVPLLMGLGFLLMIGGAILAPLGVLLSFPVALLAQYVLWVVDAFSTLPFATVQIEHISFIWLAFLYIPIGLFYWKFRKRQEFPGIDSM